MPNEIIELTGHIIDSWTLPRAWDIIMDRGGNFAVEEMRVGASKTETSYVRLKVEAPTDTTLELIISELQQLGAVLLHGSDVQTAIVEQHGVLPARFYSTTNLPTQVRLNGQWINVENIEMDVAIVIDRAKNRAYGKPMHEARVGEQVVIGYEGIRVLPFERARDRESFAFMQSTVSSEKAKVLAIHEIARQMRETRAHGGKQVEGGHRNHLRAINAIRALGSVEKAIETGLLKEGITYEAAKHNVTMVLAGSIRDDGPMPSVINEMQEAQQRMRQALPGVQMTIMIASMLHAIATGNLLPATVRTVVVDINPSVVTKLADRGSFQAAGLITDAELFLRELAEALS